MGTIQTAKQAMGYMSPSERPGCRHCQFCDERRQPSFGRRDSDLSWYCGLGFFLVSPTGWCPSLKPREVKNG